MGQPTLMPYESYATFVDQWVRNPKDAGIRDVLADYLCDGDDPRGPLLRVVPRVMSVLPFDPTIHRSVSRLKAAAANYTEKHHNRFNKDNTWTALKSGLHVWSEAFDKSVPLRRNSPWRLLAVGIVRDMTRWLDEGEVLTDETRPTVARLRRFVAHADPWLTLFELKAARLLPRGEAERYRFSVIPTPSSEGWSHRQFAGLIDLLRRSNAPRVYAGASDALRSYAFNPATWPVRDGEVRRGRPYELHAPVWVARHEELAGLFPGVLESVEYDHDKLVAAERAAKPAYRHAAEGLERMGGRDERPG